MWWVLGLALWAWAPSPVTAELLTPPYFNLAQGRRVTASATCGEGVEEPELFCKLIGTNSDMIDQQDNILIQGQVCDHCDPSRPEKSHPPQYAVDGAETWWQSPPLSRHSKYNEVNLTIDLGQEFHVAYVYIKMANSPRPGVWVLEKSADNGKTYEPWQYFADNKAECLRFFGPESLEPITKDTSVICETQYSQIVPLENGEIVVSLLPNRPSANDFFNSTSLQEWTRATNVQFRFLRTKNLLGHLMAVERQDPSVTRRYFYSIKDISIGGRCRCNGHADTCDLDPNDSYKLLCRCQHNTCGRNCETCCPGFEQKAWSQSKANKLFVCEPCNCFGHTSECAYNQTIDELGLSLDIHGNYEGGGVCQNCQDNTQGINCNQCKDGFYRPNGYHWNQTDVCQPCPCNDHRHTGNCEEGTGRCECKPEYTEPNCDACSYGYFGYPYCRPCECHLNGTRGYFCEAIEGSCPCKPNFAGKFCKECSPGFYNYPECLPCECNPLGSVNSDVCEVSSGNCTCSANFGGRQCDRCGDGYFDFPQCKYCQCDVRGTEPGICDKTSGTCLCKVGYGGPRCDQCIPGYNGYPDCRPCGCSEVGSASKVCDVSGRCPCLFNFAGKTCEQCSPGYYKYPDCFACECNAYGSKGVSCDDEGKCQCKAQFDGVHCEMCKEGLYNFPLCEECNCNPAGVIASFGGCGSVPAGELCQCRPRVMGRICDTCRPLYYNLSPYNPEGCEDCDCNLAGVVGNIAECNGKSGQCVCKPSVTSRRCDTCIAGTYDLRQDNIFGCTDCGCDVGGAVTRACNKETGQCICQPRVTGRTCREPLETHYFPTLHQFLYEVEDGFTPARTPARYQFHKDVFPGFSWRGYAEFSSVQHEVIRDDVHILKPSLYRMILRYMNLNNETVTGQIKITPESQSDTEQSFAVAFKPSRSPAFVTVSAPGSGIPSPLVMNPGIWTVSIKSQKNLLVDYFVLLPAAFYEAAILVNHVTTPCRLGDTSTCRYFSYPNLTNFDQVHGEGAYVSGAQDARRENFLDSYALNTNEPDTPTVNIPLLSNSQPELYFDLRVTKPGPHILLVNYVSPPDQKGNARIEVSTHTQSKQEKGTTTLYPCDYTIVCKHVVLDKHNKIAVYNFDSNFVSVVLKKEGDADIAIESVVAVPEESWNLDYVKPKPVCVRKNGKCVQSTFYTPAEAKKIEFEEGNDVQFANILPANIFSNVTGLIILKEGDNVADIQGKVPSPGPYKFIVHYYQPDYPEFDVDIILQNGQFYEAKMPVAHCPATSGCRTLIRQADGNNVFQLTENFVLTLKTPPLKSVWLDYVLIMPHDINIDQVIQEEALDQTAEFISQCGKDSFYIDERTTGFCRDAIFSITSAYNNGALPCQCDFDGSTSFKCEPFGGQCPCKPNVIGRKCEACEPGYYGFPDCKPCNCPSKKCTQEGECICPDHVVGEWCDQCEPYAYAYDPYNGCSACDCNPLGVEGNLQCDSLIGTCQCKPNVVGRTCNLCESGHWQFPLCHPCDCDLRGTTSDICDQDSAECFCKANVYGQACDLCKDGTFNIQEKNSEGCTKCFCFGKTTRCSPSTLYKNQIREVEGWSLIAATLGKTVTVQETSANVETVSAESIGADLTLEELRNKTVYFSAPKPYLGKKLTAYGGALNYSIFYTPGLFGHAMEGPDVILHGGDIFLLHFSLEQPAATETYLANLDIVESNFVLPNGLPTTREQIMQVLEKLQGLYIRATYWDDSVTTRLIKFSLDSASDEYNAEGGFALSVEQCQCPAAYQGLSCEECADGYYRAATGPFGGFCVPCQCNGHASTCDKLTGICLDCKHNTTGEHCENCDVGYHGNATNGQPFDCLICACPLPIPSNNFATSCELNDEGDKISCQCEPGYFGARCESCAAGFYGRPEVQGDYCKPCDCSGNIDPQDPASCDTVTGNCTRCLHNTFGSLCALCAPGYFGDAKLRDCQSCVCDRCGTRECDHESGRCQCLPNVVGEKCDRCEDKHYGYSTCQGCKACDCQLASLSLQCDDISGQCRCQPGVVGRNCDHCASGYWNYTASGCVSCGCNSEYSIGVGCNASTGQCECLPGVVGEKCDRCPPRWVLVQDQGCFECDPCHHALLDVTDTLHQQLAPISAEFETVASSFFTTQRLKYFNDSVEKLRPDVNSLVTNKIDHSPVKNKVNDIETEARSLNRKAEYKVEGAKSAGGGKLKQEAHEVEGLALETVKQSRDVVREIQNLANSLELGSGPQVDQALEEAKRILEGISDVDFSNLEQEARQGKDKAADLLEKMKAFAGPPDNMTESLEALRDRIFQLDFKLNDLLNHSQQAQANAHKVEQLNGKNRNSSLGSRVNNVKYLAKDANLTLSDAKGLVQNASSLLNAAKAAFANLPNNRGELESTRERLEERTVSQLEQLPIAQTAVNEAAQHADKLTEQASFLDSMLTDTRDSADSAIKAANVYNDIVVAIVDARKAADDAVEASNNALAKLEGISQKTDLNRVRRQTESKSEELIRQLGQVQEDVSALQKPGEQLPGAVDDIRHVAKLNTFVNSTYTQINRALQNIPRLDMQSVYNTGSLDAVTDAARNAEDKIKQAALGVPQQEQVVRQLYKDNQQALDNVHIANKELEKVSSILPDITGLVDHLKAKPQHLASIGDLIKADIENLKTKVAMARDMANRIKFGATFYRNTTLQLRNPESLPQQGLNSHVSIYFKTNEPNGLILYLGNEKGTSRKMRRSNSDDFMALQIENGYPVLTIDLGSGPEQINGIHYVSDNNWYQAVIDRTGKSVRFTVREEIDHETVKEHTVEHVLKGTSTLLNLDKDHSKLFVGGYPNTFDVQLSLKYSSFEGRIEELVIGDNQVGLWNFEDAANFNTGSEERDHLVNVTMSTGLRFNGEGYAAINSQTYGFKKRSQSDVKLAFKTYAEDGLLFLVPGAKSGTSYKRDTSSGHFMSIEMKGGRIIYQYSLGSDIVQLQSNEQYNDGNWHTVTATRFGMNGNLDLDNNKESKSFRDGGNSGDLLVHKHYYFGGHPREAGVEGVTSTGFDGCIDQVQIATASVDLNDYISAAGVTPGCPVKFAGVISFEEGARGYARWGNATARDNIVQLILKIKTNSANGLIAYAVDGQASASLQLVDGNILFKSGGQEVSTSPSTKYNDGQWHVIVATSQTNEPLLLDIDDYDNFRSPGTAIAMRLLYSNLYFGGVPSRVDAGLALQPQFAGCIGDVTLNGVVVNFANLTDIQQAIVGKCLWDEQVKPVFSAPPDREELPIDGETQKPKEILPGRKKQPQPTEEEEDTGEEGEEVSDSPISVDRFDEPKVLVTPAPTPVPNCKLPPYPASDPAITAQSGLRFGTKFGSRVEYDPIPPKLRNKFDFSVNIKTVSVDGIILYTHDQKHIDFFALYLKDGFVYYGFNCGSGTALLQSEYPVNDGEWHNIRFSRHQTAGKLFIDNTLVREGETKGSTKTINVNPPLYFGGIDPKISDNAKTNLKGLNHTFEGCLKDFRLNDKPINTPSKQFGVIPCSDKVEVGAYFSPDGGYIKFSDRFRVGVEIDIKLDIKPRDLSGLLVSVHSKKDYMLLQMIDGTIRFSVENGKGEISASYTPPTPHYFCDGQWHNIQAVKSKNVVSLSVDKISADPGIGISHSTDTKNPLYIGGHPARSRIKGLMTQAQYVGCLRNLEINGHHEPLNLLPTIGNVTQSICPTI